MESLTEGRDLALRAVGRNVANFQLLEMLLKSLASLQPVEGTHAQIQQKLATRSKRLSGATLGSAIADLLNVLDDRRPPPELHEDLYDATAQFVFSFKASEDEKQRHADALAQLLIERNDLIHKRLVTIDWKSAEQCKELSVNLDMQNDRITREIRFVSSILEEVRSMAEEMGTEAFLEGILETRE